MESLGRLFPFVYRQRYPLIVSIVFSVGAAVFTFAQLSLVYPAMKLMLEGKTFEQHVRSEIVAANEEVEAENKHIAHMDGVLNDAVWRSQNSDDALRSVQQEYRRAEATRRKAARNVAWFQWLESHALPLVPNDPFDFLAFLLGLLLVLTLFKEVCSFLQEMLVGSVVQRVMQSLRQQLFRATLRLDQQTLALETTPQLMSRFTYDLSQVAHGMVLLGNKVTLEPLKVALFIGFAFAANWRLTLLSFICAPILIALFAGVGKKLKKAAQRQMESMSRVYRVLEESLLSLRTVQAYRNERLHRRRLQHEHRSYYEKAYKILRIDAMISPSVEFLAMCAVFVASLPGAYLVLRHKTAIWGVQLASEQMTVAELAYLYACMAGVLDPGRKLSGIYSKLKKSSTACERVFGWMDRSSLLNRPESFEKMPRHQASIEFDAVTFHYARLDANEAPRRALDDITVTIPFGATVAVVGENGCGKSTLANLLPRFFDPHSGNVRIDGVDISKVDPRQLREQIGFVTQETMLFDWSIAENIRYGKSNATHKELVDAAEKAFVKDFVDLLPSGFDTTVGEKGHRLSGGQRQRIALARVILRDPSLLILDEATSAIDTQSEQCIHQALKSFTRGRTTLIVTHSMTPSLMEFVTHVLVMDQGRVISFGPHEVVLKTCPHYQRLFNAQTLKRAG